MIAKEFPKSFLAEIVNAIALILNRALTSTIEGKSTYEVFVVKLKDLTTFELLSQSALLIPPSKIKKTWDAKDRKEILVGHLDDVNGYCV